ncbi:hypothetical protein BDR07DRAFT_1386951 [Suillus spraguei]|nr:hypothetical protein BDR07DRAFT_1386951 [Suillus spraguei]
MRRRSEVCLIYISSYYTLILVTLIRERQWVSQDVPTRHLVAVGQVNLGRGKELLSVAPELLAMVRRIESIVLFFTSLEGNEATVQGALGCVLSSSLSLRKLEPANQFVSHTSQFV